MAHPVTKAAAIPRPGKDAKALIDDLASREIFFAVVGPVGSGTSEVAKTLESLVKASIQGCQVSPIKASSVIEEAVANIPTDPLPRARALQNAGDELRKADHAAVAKLLISRIKAKRAEWDAPSNLASGDTAQVASINIAEKATPPRRIYILDSLKNPAEVALLRSVYREAFCLIGVVCESETRRKRLRDGKCSAASGEDIATLMKRDEDDELDHGQKVAATFHLSDFFVDNTPDRIVDGQENREWVVTEKLGRLLDILLVKKIVRPLPSEAGMFHAASAQARSACLSRQVGAALTDGLGNIIATGTNEVPMAGGGVYGGRFESETEPHPKDHRCAVTHQYCSNSRVQDEIMDEVIAAVPALKQHSNHDEVKKLLKKTSLGRLLEFSRAVHAEMDALLSAARTGASTAGSKMFVTTFPCHYCARHLVTAGVEEVQYIEPYPKSRAFSLHGDAIEQSFSAWKSPQKTNEGKVLFRPFTGVAPRFYRQAFSKNRDLKTKLGDMHIDTPVWETGLLKASYKQIEELLSEDSDSA